jgi:glucose/arabinose dehydrogenase
MSQRSLLKIVCLMILVTSAVAVSLTGKTKGNAQEATAAKEHKGCDQDNGGLTLAVGPDGALYVSDDVKGRIWRITYFDGA